MIIAPERIAVAGPSITDREVELVAEAARHGWYARHYDYNRRFESMLATHAGVAHAISVPHATAALHLILAALGIGPGDEVIVPDLTWIASVAPVTYVGAVPVLVDILADTWCLDPEAVAAAIGPKTKAILAVDLYGSMCDWPALKRLADKHGLHLIEDAAEAIGSRLHDRPAGSFGVAAAFSFHGSKTVATGEGGMLVTDSTELYQRALVLRDHGRPVGAFRASVAESKSRFMKIGTLSAECSRPWFSDEQIGQARVIGQFPCMIANSPASLPAPGRAYIADEIVIRHASGRHWQRCAVAH